jgi:hypothetical protein
MSTARGTMAPDVSIGLGGLALGGVLGAAGSMVTRRHGAALCHQGIGRAYPLWHSALAFAGWGLIIAGVVCVLIALMLLLV